MRRFKPTLWLSFGLVSLTLALALMGYVIGLMPDGYKVELESRAKVAEALAVQLAGAANRNDTTTLEETLSSVVKRNDDVNSGAFRRSNGSVILSAGDHLKHWIPSRDGTSTPTHISVPVFGANGQQGTIELSFGPATTGKRIFGIPATLLIFLAFMMTTGFIGYFLLLRRTLRELDPGRVIPERVQKAFDTLSEGVIILDEKERILLVNQAFADIYDQKKGPAIGSKINTLSWRMVDGGAQAGGYPWHAAIREGRETRKDVLSLRTSNGNIHNFNVNATVIADDKKKTIGAIVTLSDMTALKQNKEALDKALDKLEQSEEIVEHQRNELIYLSQHDSLSGCLNRRAFFQRLDTDLEKLTDEDGHQITLYLVDVDRFGDLNRNYGTMAGDRVITGIAECLKNVVGEVGYIGRYGGDQYGIALSVPDGQDIGEIGDILLETVSESAHKLVAGGAELTVSIGASEPVREGGAVQTLINHAEEALGAAKREGGNVVVHWVSDLDTADGNSKMRAKTGKSRKRSTETPAHLEESALAPVANLAAFMGRVEQTLSHTDLSGKQSALLQVSVSSWDYLTEALGDKGSGKLMRGIERKAAQALRDCDDIVAIANTGELLINVVETKGRDELNWVVEQLLDDLRLPFEIEGHDVFVACNAGIALFPGDGATPAILARNAGAAMRRARAENRIEGFQYYSADMIQSSQDRLDIESGIREALQRDEFELFFQPIVDLQSGALSAAECLLRCNNESLKDVYMDRIVGVAEKSSLIAEIDMWVLNAAIAQMQKWCDAGVSLPKISINISATQFTNINFMDRVFDTIKEVRFSPSRIQIEVTETARMADVNIAAPQLKRLQQLGVVIALDDFGTGQASLTYLQRLHPDTVKIDRSFVTGVHANHANATMVSAMTVMAHCLGLKVVVEGVEDENEFEFLRQTRCDEMQGYYISKPMPVGAMNDWMKLFIRDNGTNNHMNENVDHGGRDKSKEVDAA